jgi:hypothetical protein
MDVHHMEVWPVCNRQAAKGGLGMKSEHEKRTPGRSPKIEKTEFSPQERRFSKRRKKHIDKGYVYISTVGWIDRRENCRRASDNYTAIG